MEFYSSTRSEVNEAVIITFSHDVTMKYEEAEHDSTLLAILEEFKEKNKHLIIEHIEFGSDGDGSWVEGEPGTGNMTNYISICVTEITWWKLSKNNPTITINGKNYKQFSGFNNRFIDLEDKKTYWIDIKKD